MAAAIDCTESPVTQLCFEDILADSTPVRKVQRRFLHPRSSSASARGTLARGWGWATSLGTETRRLSRWRHQWVSRDIPHRQGFFDLCGSPPPWTVEQVQSNINHIRHVEL
jgi:hypothetical protein